LICGATDYQHDDLKSEKYHPLDVVLSVSAKLVLRRIVKKPDSFTLISILLENGNKRHILFSRQKQQVVVDQF